MEITKLFTYNLWKYNNFSGWEFILFSITQTNYPYEEIELDIIIFNFEFDIWFKK
jgi:hypothetical protein